MRCKRPSFIMTKWVLVCITVLRADWAARRKAPKAARTSGSLAWVRSLAFIGFHPTAKMLAVHPRYQKKPADLIDQRPPLSNATHIGQSFQHRFKCKAFVLAHTVAYFLQNQLSCFDGRLLWHNQVGIDKALALRFMRQKKAGKGRFSCSIWANDNDVFFRHASTSTGVGKSCCIKPFLWVFSASSFLVCAAMRSSRVVRQSAMRCCSATSFGYEN